MADNTEDRDAPEWGSWGDDSAVVRDPLTQTHLNGSQAGLDRAKAAEPWFEL